jgi:ethanolamine utilization microcompartment shell protein EutS
MASLIRLKQIESSSGLISAANIGVDINNSVIGIIISSLRGALSILATDVEVAAVSASIAATERGFVTTGSFNAYTQSVSQSFSASAVTLYVTSSQIIDQGEF